jgi:hypothetical protein
MALYKDPVTTLLEVIEKENNVTLDPADYDFSIPEPATPPAESSAVYNTKIIISANNVAAPFAGDIDIFYNRLNLSDLDSMVAMYIRSPELATTHDILPSLNRRFGLNLTPADIILENTAEFEGYRIAHLKAEDTSIGWIGGIDVSVVEGDVLLEDHLLDRALGGLYYPTEYPTKPFAQFYSYWRDFSDHYNFLATVVVGDPIGMEIASAMGDVTGDPWQTTGQNEYSLGNAEIIYAGLTADTGLANDDYDRVIIIRLDLDTCTGMTGDLVIHFSEPEDPLAIPG